MATDWFGGGPKYPGSGSNAHCRPLVGSSGRGGDCGRKLTGHGITARKVVSFHFTSAPTRGETSPIYPLLSSFHAPRFAPSGGYPITPQLVKTVRTWLPFRTPLRREDGSPYWPQALTPRRQSRRKSRGMRIAVLVVFI